MCICTRKVGRRYVRSDKEGQQQETEKEKHSPGSVQLAQWMVTCELCKCHFGTEMPLLLIGQ